MADHCGPVSIVNKNTSCLSQLPKRLREYKANDSEMSWRLQRGGQNTHLTYYTSIAQREPEILQPHHIFLVSDND